MGSLSFFLHVDRAKGLALFLSQETVDLHGSKTAPTKFILLPLEQCCLDFSTGILTKELRSLCNREEPSIFCQRSTVG